MTRSFWFEIVIGGWVLISPWVLGISSNALGKWSNVLVGMLLILRALWTRFGGHEHAAHEESRHEAPQEAPAENQEPPATHG